MNSHGAMVILNPYAARWIAQERQAEVLKALADLGQPFDLQVTEKPGHATHLAEQAVTAGYSPILAAGGDGTISEIVNGIGAACHDRDWVPLGLLPLGTANDLVDNLSISRDIHEAVRIVAEGNTRSMDVCQVNERFFVNNAGLGLEPFTTTIQMKIKRLRGTLRYIVAVLVGIARNPQWTMQMEWDDGSYEGPVTMVSIGNCSRTGGFFYTVPGADPFDGKLTFVYGYVPNRLGILRILPKTMKPGDGNYVEEPAVHQINCTWLRVHTDQPSPMHADGELLSLAIQDISYQVFPKTLPVFVDPA